MADPICRWRNTTPETVKLLVSLLPKVEMPEAGFKEEVKKNCAAKKFDFDKFFTTAYQLAVQIGLYYVDSNGMYHPRFDHDLSDAEAAEYVSRVASLYVSPNPYAKSMDHAKSVACLYDLFVQRAGSLRKGASIDVKKELENYYHLPIGNTDMVVNLMAASGAFDKVDGQHITYKGFDDVAKDKELFFKHFGRSLGQAISSCGHRITENVLLRVGDTFSGKDDGTFTVVEVLPRIYRIRANKSGKIRSVPKAVVAAWRDFYKKHPFVDYDEKKKDGTIVHKKNVPIAEASTRYIRDKYMRLLTDDDPYEHGYDGMLGSVARWLIAQNREEEETVYSISLEDGESPVCEDDNQNICDRLSIALKIFAESRGTEKTEGWSNYDEWTHALRTEFAAVCPSLMEDVTFDYLGYMRKYAISWQVANTKFSTHTDDEKRAVLTFLKEQKTAPKSASWYIDEGNRLKVGGAQVKGMSPKTVLYFMSELHPNEFAVWTEPTYDALVFLGLHKGAMPSELTIDTYEDCKAKQHQIVSRMKELGIGKASDDASDPDYHTVNEFIWWVNKESNQDLIKERAMAKEFKDAPKKAKPGDRKLSEAVKDDDMLQRLMAALRTKPFAILAGHSGTGKSQLVRRLAYMTCNDEELFKEKDRSNAPGNYCMVQVKPNWHDSTDLLGYYTEMNGGKYHTTPFVEFICKAYAYPETPFFVCLDEMNLAPVEQYFAEFLSAIESYSETTKLTDRLIAEKANADEICGKTKLTESLAEVTQHGLTIPRNLFVVGTVNVDETTCQFSRKVLDRAMTILMTAVSFKSMTAPNDPSKEECLDPDDIKFFLERPTQTSLVNGQMEWLDKIQKQVGDTPFAIAYRFGNEYALYQSAYQLLMNNGIGADGKPNPEDADSQKTAIDHVVLMKLLPRIHGARPEMEVWFNGKDGDANKIGLVKTLGDGQSVDMMKSILARVGEYLSFWP